VAYFILDRSVLRHGVRRTISGCTLRLPVRYSREYPPLYEPEKFAFLRAHCRPGTTALDIGAHIGVFSVLMARSVGAGGRIFAFEPTPKTREVLRRTIALNDCHRIVEVRAEAVSDASGTRTFYDIGADAPKGNSLIQIPESRPISVQTLCVDEFLRQRDARVACMKIDAEGAELEILRGAVNTIATCRPAIQLEIHPETLRRGGFSTTAIWELLDEQRMSILYEGRPVDRGWFCERRELMEVQVLPREGVA
jgi:FkbM family methyltransferase